MTSAVTAWTKTRLRRAHRVARRLAVRMFLSYDTPDLVAALATTGIRRGDSVMLHSAFEDYHGFRGSTAELIDAFLGALGPDGNLLMVSLPYRSSTRDWIDRGKVFDVRKTPSAMGLVSEAFRRRPGVRRSLHPTHPVLAFGPRAEWLLEGHEATQFPCGPGSPFERLLEIGGKAAFFNADFANLTFFHFLEHHVNERLGIALYEKAPRVLPVVDASGTMHTIQTYIFDRGVIPRRRFDRFEREARSRGLLRETRVGASRVIACTLRELVECTDDMYARGVTFYDGVRNTSPREGGNTERDPR